MYLTVCPLRGPGVVPGCAGVSQRTLPWLITLFQPVLTWHDRKWFYFPSMAPHNLWPSMKKTEVQPLTANG